MARVHNTNPENFPPPKFIINSAICVTPLFRQEGFLRQKYEQERLSTRQIAAQSFSARSTVSKYLKLYGIAPEEGLLVSRDKGQLAFGERHSKGELVSHQREQRVIQLMLKLRSTGLSYWKIADELTKKEIPTKNGNVVWKAASVMKICKRALTQIEG